ncbi:membrane integrity-associated transporter subunit PqiC [Jinshanibacter sp. LJY008]|uniref:Membrane integrity-associated transporter subunit PqiC n=1 Tax=Limnobaculum eriocheiris TaxID=2897391 RepID=A0A9X1SL70_9GAMM|nr:membrane integrity-associated transporter subunit PqiC [Limnobaculum eriocheiris]MCD1126049.1 membrane integrity-associated transporter subunit PqiC [Limnobaculum eriocheiris]
MMKWTIATLALLLSACSSQPQVSYYQLPSAGAAKTSSAAISVNSDKQLWIENVTVADFLSGAGIVYQTSNVKYTIANNNLWGSGLEQQLKQALTDNLNAQLNGWVVSAQPIGGSNDTDVLRITVSGFHGRYDGYAVVSGYWILQHGNQIIRRPFDIETPLQKDGYDELVHVLANAWQQEAVQIAKALKN